MAWWQWALNVVLALIALLLAYGLALIIRRRLLARNGGTFELSYRARSDKVGRGWVLGIGRYTDDRLEWFRVFSLSPRPRLVWKRSRVAYAGRRSPGPGEQLALYADHLIVQLTTTQGDVELAMNPSSLMGLQSWLEASPPGTDWDQHRNR